MNEQLELPEPPWRFDGDTFDSDRDGERLTGQLKRVWQVVRDGEWWTLRGIRSQIRDSFDVADSEAAISARLRDLRKARFGSHVVEREYVGSGLFRYRLLK